MPAKKGTKKTKDLFLFASSLLLLTPAPALAQTVAATVGVGINPRAVAVDAVSNKIFVANYGYQTFNYSRLTCPHTGSVSEIDGATNSVHTSTVWGHPNALAVDAATDRIYMTSYGQFSIQIGACEVPAGLTIIDGTGLPYSGVSLGFYFRGPLAVAVNAVTDKIYVADTGGIKVFDGSGGSLGGLTEPTNISPGAVAVNPTTNKIYVANTGSNNITVIDGATNSVTAVTDHNAIFPIALVVNERTNKIYVANFGSNNVTVIDGLTDSVTTVTDHLARSPAALAVNPKTNKVYVVNSHSDNVTVIDGETYSTTLTDPHALNPVAVAVDPGTDRIYVANSGSNNVSVIDGSTNSLRTVTDPLAVGPSALAVNPTTNKIYVANSGSNNVTVINDGFDVVPGLNVSPSSLSFGEQPIGSTSTETLTLTNGGSTSISGISLTVYSLFNLSGGTCGTALAAGASCVIGIGFTPTGLGAAVGTLTISSSSPSNPTLTVPLSGTGIGTGIGPVPSLAPSSLSFGNVLAGTISPPQTATLTNVGNAPLTILSMVYNDNAPGGLFLSFHTATCAPNLSVAPGSSCTISIEFEANAAASGPQAGSVIVNFAAGGSATLQLSANVIL